MQRDIDLSWYTDGKKYSLNDMPKIGCMDCKGCSECCKNVGSSIVLDPYDIHCLLLATGKDFNTLLSEERIELSVVDGVILPNLKLWEGKGCSFLNQEGRCSIHKLRPGFCRLYPLARVYENGGFYYGYLTEQCHTDNPRTKVKISKWLSIDRVKLWEQFVNEWHYFLKKYQDRFMSGDTEGQKDISMGILSHFYGKAYSTTVDFYEQFEQRMQTFSA